MMKTVEELKDLHRQWRNAPVDLDAINALFEQVVGITEHMFAQDIKPQSQGETGATLFKRMSALHGNPLFAPDPKYVPCSLPEEIQRKATIAALRWVRQCTGVDYGLDKVLSAAIARIEAGGTLE